MEQDLYLAAGCFWGAEHYLKQIDGVTFTEVGFAGGHTDNPTYEQVYTDTTGHAETVHLRADPLRVNLPYLLDLYFRCIDPTSLNQQGADHGTRYRTGIYYTNPDHLPFIRHSLAQLSTHYSQPLQVEVLPLNRFWRAEEYHQDYLEVNPDGYCHLPSTLFAQAAASHDTLTASKNERYSLLLRQAQALSQDEHDPIALMANIAALLHEAFGFWWTGFYRVQGNELVLGPFQGPVACMRIGYGRGVCGTAWQQGRTLMVPNVEAFEGHIACSAASRSEIVVPVPFSDGIAAVLDIDSQHYSTFDECDAHWLQLLVQNLR